MSVNYRLFCGAAACALAVGCVASRAQTPQVNAAIQQLQQQIEQMQQQLQSLQTQVTAQAQQPPASAPAPASGPHVTQSGGNRFGLESGDGQYSIALTGRLHFDVGGYTNYHQDSHATAPSDLNAGINARRARLGVIGKFAGDWNYAFVYDLGGSSDGFDVTNPSGGGGLGVSGGFLAGIENAYVTYNGLNNPKSAVPLAFDFGYQDTPFTLDEATSSNDIMFMERASSQVVATAFGSGDNRSAFGVRSNDARYWAGVYVTGPTSGSAHNVGEPLAMFGRFTYQALQAPDYSLHFGVDLEGLLKPANVTTTAAGAAPGTISASLRTLSLSDRPELRIDPSTLLATGTIGTAANPVTGGSVFGAETAGGYQNLFFQSEGFNYRVTRAGLPDNTFWGGYLEGSWTITGEHRTYNPGSGAYTGINPAHPLSISAGTWGALELAARASYISLSDNFNPIAVAGKSNSVEGGRQTIYTMGLNWYLNPNMRLMFDWLHGTVKKQAATPIAPQTGANFDAVAMRAQVAF
ncbi:MAG TPA: porin [Stellaceae bacterium]|nr:porin [Stellaceae bacterium]